MGVFRVFTAFPRSFVVEGAALRQEGGNRRGTEGRKLTNGKFWLVAMLLITSHVAQNIGNIMLDC